MAAGSGRHVSLGAKEQAKAVFGEILATALVLSEERPAKKEAFGKTRIGSAASRLPDVIDSALVRRFIGITDAGDVEAVRRRVEQLKTFLEFAQANRIADLQWSTLEADLRPSHARRTGDSNQLFVTVCHLLGKEASEIAETVPTTTPGRGTTAPAAPAISIAAGGVTSSSGASSRPRILLDCHETIYDHRHLIVGQLPRPGLFPCVFVRPADMELWFAQEVVRLKEPEGVAFVSHARFGNPDGIGHEAPLGVLWRGEVLVHAFQIRPGNGDLRQPLSESQLAELVARCGSEAKEGPFPVKRQEPSLSAVIGRGEDPRQNVTLRSTQVVKCSFPIDLSWNGNVLVSYEFRRMPYDVIEWDGDISPGKLVRIVAKGSDLAPPPQSAGGSETIELSSGIYRVRSWAHRKPVLDPLEFWLEIG